MARTAARQQSGARLVPAPSSTPSAGPPWDAGDICYMATVRLQRANRGFQKPLYMYIFCSLVQKDTKGNWMQTSPFHGINPNPFPTQQSRDTADHKSSVFPKEIIHKEGKKG